MRNILAFILVTLALSASAHNSKISTFTLRDVGPMWVLDMNIAHPTMEAAMLRQYGKEEALTWSVEDYNNKAYAYIKDHFDLVINGEQILLDEGGIKGDKHTTNLRFLLPEVKQVIDQLDVHIPMFSFSNNHTNIFRIYRGGKNFTKFFLHADNGFEAYAENIDGTLEQVDKPKEVHLAKMNFWVAPPVLAAVLLLLLRVQRYWRNKPVAV